LFENPVGNGVYCGLPRIAIGPDEYTPAGLPVRIEKTAAALTATYANLRCVGGPQSPGSIPGRFTITWRAADGALHCEGHLSLGQIPGGISIFIPETDRPLNFAMNCAQPFHQDVIAVGGMADWRSCWGEAKYVHQVHFKPAEELRYAFTLAPKLRVRSVPADDHDYTRALFESMPPAFIEKRPRPPGVEMDAAAMAANVDIFHVGWPEHLFGAPSRDIEAFDRHYFEFIEALGRSGARIVWTMHNRRPHYWDAERGRALYRAWARIVDGVIHHSQWGMNLMRSELPFREGARHVVVPHGHFGEQMRVGRSRVEIEAALGLPPCPMRFGIIGRWQKEKQVEMIIAAFQRAARPDQQLVLTAYTSGMEKPADPRVFFLPRNDWMLREEIAGHVRLCDALVSAHTGDTYLTSGVSADAIGAGIGMFAPHWDYFHETLGDAPFYHDNTEDSLAAAFASVTPAGIERARSAFRALQPGCAWPVAAGRTVSLYRSLGRK
jgi:glycosyltransferase involved in cell wall biosynthesis